MFNHNRHENVFDISLNLYDTHLTESLFLYVRNVDGADSQ